MVGITMKKTKKISYLLLSLILAISLVGIIPVSAQDGSDAPYGPYPDTLIVFLHADESTVIPRIETGEMDGWLWWLNSENTELAEQNTAIDLVGGFGLYNGMQFNPLETTGGFNIFSIKEVREAMDILGGNGGLILSAFIFDEVPHEGIKHFVEAWRKHR